MAMSWNSSGQCCPVSCNYAWKESTLREAGLRKVVRLQQEYQRLFQLLLYYLFLKKKVCLQILRSSHSLLPEFTFMTAKTHTNLLPGQPHPNLFSFFPASQQLVANQHNFHFLKFLFLLRCSSKAKDEIIDIKTKEIFTRTCAGFSQKLHHAQFLPTTED